MKRFFAPILLLLTACGPGAEVTNGRELYLAYGCAACHGERADGNGPSAGLSFVRPRDLRNVNAFNGPKTVEGISSTIAFGVADGRTGMPAYPEIPPQERLAIARYIHSLADEPRTITADDAWAAESNPAWKIASAYVTLTNATNRPAALVKVTTPAAGKVEMHVMETKDEVMSMRQVERIDIPPNGTAQLRPNGTHLMLLDLVSDLQHGQSIVLTLTFDDGTIRAVHAPVRRMVPTSPASAIAPQAATTERPLSFTLIDQNNAPFTFRRGPALLFLGYTHCPDACPTTLAKIARAYRDAGTDARAIPTLFISVDPRDTPEVMKTYLSYFGAVPAKGLTGSKQQIDEVVRQLGARYELRENGAVDHTVSIYLIGRDGRVARKFDPAGNAEELGKAMKAMLRE